jgi:hypothetical protein
MTDQTNATAPDWTPEPWYAHGADIRTNADERVNIYDHDPSNRERIVACVNALAGIPDPAAFVKQAKEAAAAVQAERERCLAWVEQLIKDNYDIIRRHGPDPRTVKDTLEACIEDLALIRERITSGETL